MHIYDEKDVVVIGGGTAGVPAALSAARNGASTLIIEQSGFLGGTMTGSLLPHMQTFHDAQGEQAVNGIAQETVDRLIETGGAVGHLRRDRKIWGDNTITDTPYDNELLKIVFDQMIEEAGIDVLFHTFLSDVIRKDNEIKGVIIENKTGRQIVSGKVFIDATGDGDAAFKMGACFNSGRDKDGICQPASYQFMMGNINFNKLEKYSREKGFKFIKAKKPNQDNEECIRIQGKMPPQAVESGDIPERYAKFNLESIHSSHGVLGHPHVFKFDATNAEELSKANVIGRKRVWDMVHYLKKYIPGFEDSILLQTPPQLGIRETRRIVGEYTLQLDDVLSGRDFEDSIARGAFPIDVHAYESQVQDRWDLISSAYGIPFRCLIPQGIEQLLIAGRCISASHEANASARVTPTVMAIGEAAGTAAALAVKRKESIRKVPIKLLRSQLREAGAIV